ncbi:MAG: DUF1015 domain-containing protein, partial [Bacteroidia bacterium]|nr:DUF1015 domain-containing protein [Bacteroidia bacterium]
MPKIFPFKAVRPSPGMELLVSASTHDTTIKGQLTSLEENPFTYLHVIKPHLHFNEEKNPDKHFPMAKSYLKQLISQKVLNQDEKPAFYIYRQTKSDQTSFTGIIATVSANDYFEGHIKVHENTLTEKEAQLVEHIRITGVMGEPVLLTYRRQQSVDLLINEYTKDQAPIDFTDENLTSHEIWIIEDEAGIESLSLQFGAIDNFYIADGHHRSAAAAKYIRQYRDNEGGYLSCLIPDNQLRIASFHRIITKMDNFDKIVFLEKLKVEFEVELSNEPVTPVSKYQFGLCLKGKWYILRFKYPEDL